MCGIKTIVMGKNAYASFEDKLCTCFAYKIIKIIMLIFKCLKIVHVNIKEKVIHSCEKSKRLYVKSPGRSIFSNIPPLVGIDNWYQSSQEVPDNPPVVVTHKDRHTCKTRSCRRTGASCTGLPPIPYTLLRLPWTLN